MSNQGAQYLMQLFSFPSLSLLKTVFRPLSIIVWTRTRMMLIRAAFVNPITNGGAIALLKNSDATMSSISMHRNVASNFAGGIYRMEMPG